MILGEWQSGFEDYALANPTNSRVRLPIESFYVQASYFLTGERLASRGRVKPLRSFDLRPGRFGLGAWEVVFRYADLSLGRQVFTAGLADPNNWTNQPLHSPTSGSTGTGMRISTSSSTGSTPGSARRWSTAPAASPGPATCSCSGSRSGSERAGRAPKVRARSNPNLLRSLPEPRQMQSGGQAAPRQGWFGRLPTAWKWNSIC